MTLRSTLLILLFADILEAGGDALCRTALHTHAVATRIGFLAAGALVLASYGIVVNQPPWDFGQLLGLYVVFFFVTAQAIGWIFFHQRPTASALLGGAFIVTGGIVLTIGSLR